MNLSVELITPSGDGPMAERLRAVLDAQGEGLASLAFAVNDIEAAHRRLTRLGLDPEPVTAAESVDRTSGARRQWRRTRAATASTHGVRIFLIEPSPAARGAIPRGGARRRRRARPRRRSARPIPDRAAALYGARLGLDMRLDRSNPAWGSRLMFFRCGDLIVEIAHDLEAGVSSGPDRLWGLSWRVPDALAAHARIRSAGLDVTDARPGRKPGTHVFTVRDGTCGVPTLMLQPSPDRPERGPLGRTS